MKNRGYDKAFAWILATLVFVGFFIFISASMGMLDRAGITFSRIIFNQVLLGLVLGSIALVVAIRIPYTFWNTYAFYIFLGTVVLTLLVFVPGLGFAHGGARRWLSIGSFSFQPAEALKIGFVMYFAAWLSAARNKIQTYQYGLLPLVIILGIVGGVLLLQPDTGTLLVIFVTALGMFFVAGGRFSHIALLGSVGALGIGLLAIFRPYVRSRILTFINPLKVDPTGTGAAYQIKQSLIAIGSGGPTGRGFGQSVQKFNFLPEPVGDSIFAVFAEEWGFIGAIILIALFVAFAIQGLRIANRAPTIFTKLLATGLILLVVTQSLVNIASMLGIAPLTGMPLIFVSQGGTALLAALASMGVVLHISRYAKK